MNLQDRWIYTLKEEAGKTNSRYQPTKHEPGRLQYKIGRAHV